MNAHSKENIMNARLDYLRLATWNTNHYAYMASAIMRTKSWDFLPGNWLQYSGHRAKQFFMGSGKQQGRRHHVVSASGSLSERIYTNLMGLDGFYCTRIDIQITVPKQEWVDLAKLHKSLGKKKTTLISSKENDTLYFGSRGSTKFARLYEKKLGDKMYLRMEFELKGDMAAGTWNAILGGETVGNIYKRLLMQSILPNRFMNMFENAEDNATDKALRAEIDHDNQKILSWVRSLDNAMRKHIHNHEIGEEVSEIIRSWALETTFLDNENNNL